jgi:hypothetical protein
MVQSPAWDVRDGSDQYRFALAAELKKPQQAAQGTGRDLCRSGATSGCISRCEGHHILGANRLPSHGTVSELGLEKFAGVTSPIDAGGLGQATGIAEIPTILLQGHIDGIPW